MPGDPPLIRCTHSAQRCPLMRRCPCCGEVKSSMRHRITHQNECRQVMNVTVAEQQHHHLIAAHRRRRR